MSAAKGSSGLERAADAEERVRHVELAISTALRAGVLLSLLFIVVGTAISFAHNPSYISSAEALQRLTEPGAAFPHTVADVFAGIMALRGQAFVTLGLLLLIVTPIVRVAISILGFIYQGDYVYTAITGVVLTLLVLSFLFGKVE